jgi:RHS repeat-associated protein
MYFHNNILCLKCCNACWYDVYLNRFTQPDSIIPSPGNSQDWDRYSYARNNPVKYIDPSGHYICEDIECRGTPKNYGERKEKNQNSNGSNLLNDIWDSYSQGWSNFNSAWSTIVAPDTPVIAEVYSVTYVIGWGGAHAGLILGAGGLACSATGPSCVKVVEGFLGISGAASADGDPTNEVQAVGKTIEVADDIENWLGDDLVGIRNEAGDFILRNVENTRKFRFDYYNTSPHTSPHFHLEWLNKAGEWITTRIFPNDVPPH